MLHVARYQMRSALFIVMWAGNAMVDVETVGESKILVLILGLDIFSSLV